MKKIIFYLILIFIFTSSFCSAQIDSKSLIELKGNNNSLAFYISGDAGLNIFSLNICKELNNNSYNIIGLNSNDYFNIKKTPQRAAKDIEDYLSKINFNKYENIFLIGYSFGADVTPFIYNALSTEIKKRIKYFILIAPSPGTDFEIHWLDKLGLDIKRDMNVIQEINSSNFEQALIIINKDESEFNFKSIYKKNCDIRFINGGHHFNGNFLSLIKTMTVFMDSKAK